MTNEPISLEQAKQLKYAWVQTYQEYTDYDAYLDDGSEETEPEIVRLSVVRRNGKEPWAYISICGLIDYTISEADAKSIIEASGEKWR